MLLLLLVVLLLPPLAYVDNICYVRYAMYAINMYHRRAFSYSYGI